ncbi:MAG: hypothetical protein ACOYPS_02675 [Phycisphaerales bacterium]|jgi:hypothetical protein
MRIKSTFFGVAALACLAGSAFADLCSWNWSRGLQPFDDTAGHVDNFNATYDTQTHDFTWSVSYSDRIADGFWLMLNSTSPLASGSGQVAVLYADFTNSVLTAYAFNGVDAATSWMDGGSASGLQQPDRIFSSLDADDASSSGVLLGRILTPRMQQLSITMNASAIQLHDPLHGALTSTWTGLAFGDPADDPRIGVSFRSVDGLEATYDGDGSLTSWDYTAVGAFDGSMLPCERLVPAPGAASLALAGLLLAGRRERRSRA